MTNLNKNRHSVYKLQFHLILVTKYRHPFINKKINIELKEIIKNLMKKWKLNLISIETEEDHLHILFEGNPQLQLSKFVGNLKTVTSRMIRNQNKEYLKQYYWENVMWEPSYFISSVGDTNLEIVKKYIEGQKSPNK
jgi:putative transposase